MKQANCPKHLGNADLRANAPCEAITLPLEHWLKCTLPAKLRRLFGRK